MNNLDDYLHAATRDNTRKSYQSAVRHFEVHWGGFLPATADSISRYLAEHAESLSINTLRQRLAALGQWHINQGFPDPTKAPVVRKAMRGIRALHPSREKRARPLQLVQLTQAGDWLAKSAAEAEQCGDQAGMLRHLRDRSMLLLGFWRGFRGDELTSLEAQNVETVPGEGLICYLGQTKGDRMNEGRSFAVPALNRLCPVDAYLAWTTAASIASGPVFRAIDQWGHVSAQALNQDSIIPIPRRILMQCGIEDADLYSAHSLRRGFATWAGANGWDVAALMHFVGWKAALVMNRLSEDSVRRHQISRASLKELTDDANAEFADIEYLIMHA
jgi:site-specific recombinase XerD